MDGWQGLADTHGVLRAGDAFQAGVAPKDLARLVAAGELERLGHGWYLVAPAAPSPGQGGGAPWEGRRRLHVAQTRATVRAYEGRVLASHHSALVLEGLPTYAADLRQVHVTRVSGASARKRPGLTVHRAVPGLSAGREGIVDIGSAVMGVGRLNGEMAALVAADAALNRGQLTLHELAEAASRVAGPGSAIARRVAGAADPRAESPGETRLRHALRLMGYAVTSQVAIVDGAFVAIVDFLIEGCRVVVEFDGFVKYGRTAPSSTAATPGDVLFAEKVREDRIRGLDYGMVRVIWRDLEDLIGLHRRIDTVVDVMQRLSA